MIRFALMVAAALSPICAYAQFRCTGPDGSTTFQQTPCPQGQTAETLKLNVLPSIEDGRPAHIKQAIAQRQIALGMTRRELDLVMRTAPDKVNSSIYASGRHDQIIYVQAGRTLYVYTENDVVTAVQDQEGRTAVDYANEPRRASRPSRQCPSAAEIRSLEIDKSLIRNQGNHALQAELARQIAAAKACRAGR